MSDLDYINPKNKKQLKMDANRTARTKNRQLIHMIVKGTKDPDTVHFYRHDTVVNPWCYD